MVTIQGYALSGGGRGIERVDVSIDGGKTWLEAKRYQKQRGDLYSSDTDNDCEKWAWVLWEITVQIYPPVDIIAKAVDSSANTQPEKVKSIWNLRGVLNNSWHCVQVQAENAKDALRNL
ncbi:hypothetical protein O6H91_10G085600 [Diphasiastrum complanatum]|nr:hypothetical protein O6H91_10G085600 [Diphasiastrum complanatum]